MSRLVGADTRVVNIGLGLFAEILADLRVPVVHVDWRPPAGGDARLAELLERAGDECSHPHRRGAEP